MAGGTVNIAGGAKIHGDLIVAAGVINIAGEVEGKTKIFGGKVLLNGRLSGDINIQTDSLEIGDKAYLQGNLTCQASKEAGIDPKAKVLGKIEYKPVPKIEKRKHKFFSYLLSRDF